MFSSRSCSRDVAVPSHFVPSQQCRKHSGTEASVPVQKAELVSACKALGVSTEGTREDILNRLQELLLYKDIYPKMFVKLQKAGGGVLHVSCQHSIVYYCSPLWQESARDHADALLSFQHPPNVYICDVAGRVARHLNNRTEQGFFQPDNGKLCETTEENIEKALKKTLQLSLPWLTVSQFKGIKEMDCTAVHSRPHPVTGTNECYSLYDRFHQKNQKRPEERLRSLDLVPELRSTVNTAVAEQLNQELASSRYFLCIMKDRHFMFSLRLMFHLHNQKCRGARGCVSDCFVSSFNVPSTTSYFHHSMVTDVQLAIFANVLGVSLFLLVVLYHYVAVNNPKKLE
ncbi:hypothetical protein SRHO_G00006310 [Serrasalmus rhombeus]